ncbi:hypothetical protein [Comamonas serinivorans]|uniref:hypothetical protein n=1 Tax=Comamonas serinivorans TaxID=1082851 RepID=UPI0012F7B093|nr:hypothetical protein [Comamonas serinivorans]
MAPASQPAALPTKARLLEPPRCDAVLRRVVAFKSFMRCLLLTSLLRSSSARHGRRVNDLECLFCCAAQTINIGEAGQYGVRTTPQCCQWRHTWSNQASIGHVDPVMHPRAAVARRVGAQLHRRPSMCHGGWLCLRWIPGSRALMTTHLRALSASFDK